MTRTMRMLSLGALALLTGAGCRQEMANQPRYNPLAESDFFGDGRSARAPEPGTVARGESADDAALDNGRSQEARWAASVTGSGAGFGFNLITVYRGGFSFPVPVDDEVMRRGQERFNIYCAVCHDRVGTGRGKIVERGYLRPPSYHIERLRNAPLAHYYEVVSNGYGAMPSYSDKLTPDDRWAVIAYIRALQWSQYVRYADLTDEERRKLPSPKEQP
jgi:mono/diheme cytochrome c family protein